MTVQLRISIPKDDDSDFSPSPRCEGYGRRERCNSITNAGLAILSIPRAVITLPLVITATCGVSLYNIVHCLIFMDCDNLSPNLENTNKPEEP